MADHRRPFTVSGSPAVAESRLVIATDNGRTTWQQRRDALQQVEAHILGPLTPSSATTFRALLQELACRAQTLDPPGDLCEVAQQVQPAEESPAQSSRRGRHRAGSAA